MIAIIVVLVGYAIIFGAKGVVERLVKVAVGLVLMVTFLPGIVTRAGAALHGVTLGDLPGLPHAELLLPALGLAALGLAAWKLRAFLARRREALARRHGAPRDRERPPAPRAAHGRRG